MKNRLLFIALLTVSVKLIAQPIPVPSQTDPNISSPVSSGNLIYPANYENDIISSSNIVNTGNCNIFSSDYVNKYSKFQTYIPTINTPVKTIKIALHFFQKADGSNMWQNNAYTITNFNLAVNWLNHRREFTDSPSWPIPGIPFIADARIRYELTGIYFYQDNTLNTSSNVNQLQSAVMAADPTRLNSIPIYFTNGSFGGASAFATTPIYQNRTANSSIVVFGDGSSGSVPSGTIDHELGHCLGLYHTYQNGCCPETNDMTNPEYMSDVFDVSWNNYCSPPANRACYHQGGWNWDPYDHVTNPYSTNNLMGACLYMGYVSPMQMGKMHRTLSTSNVRKYVKEVTSAANYPLVVNNNETWDFDIQMYQDIVVKTGATLTIRCVVGMANNGRIIVERGGRLIVDGGEINAWGPSWSGIQVWGTSNQPQRINANGLSTYQGIVKIINQGLVRDAKIGIITSKNDENGNIDWGGYFGGIVQCDNAKFINNKISATFWAYHNFLPFNGNKLANISYINRSLFEVNSNLKDPSEPYFESFINLWAVEGIKLYGNVYQNINPNLPNIENRGNGITSYDGSFFLDRYKVCSIYGSNGCAAYSTNIQSKFLNLNYGIHSTEASPFASITANDNDFVNCNRAIYISGTHNSRITNNRIDIAQGGTTNNTYPYGIYSEVSTGYDISNNNLTTTATNNFNNSATGIFFYQTGGLTNMLYRNSINKLNVATTIVGDNRGNNPGDGLQLRCNQYGQTSQNWMDIWLHDDGQPWGNVGMIDAIQGNSNIGANNRFSHNSASPPPRDFYDEGNPTVTYFFNPEISQNTQPFYYSSQLLPNANSSALNYNSMCPLSLNSTSGLGVGQVLGLIAKNTASITALKSVIDANNTAGLIDAINSNMSEGNLKNVLDQASPYLSDEVLMIYFSKTSTPNGHILEIHDKNKPVSQTVWQVLLDRNLPNGILQNLTEQQNINTPSARILLETQIATLNQEKALAVDNQVKSMLTDTIKGYNQDSIITLLIADNRIRSKNRLLSYYVANEKLAEATNLLYDIKAENNGSLDNFSKLQELIVTLKLTSDKIYTIKTDAQIRNAIELIANDKNDYAYAHAQALLSKVFGYKYEEYVKLPSIGSGLRLKQNQITESFESVTNSMLIYPNPTNNNTNVLCLLPAKFSSAAVIVYDLMGKELLKESLSKDKTSAILNTQNLTSGIYFVNLFIDNNLTEIKKLIKQ
ncbi:MAG: zinc-dependent metalloprotease [Bacteroidia bacterium]|nr:zinc-dependent metalloprotease [Bacteroidia bacterium]